MGAVDMESALGPMDEETQRIFGEGSLHFDSFDLPVATGIAVVGTIQLACRHPEFAGPTRVMAEDFARHLQERLNLTPFLTRLLEAGWNPEFDATVTVKRGEPGGF